MKCRIEAVTTGYKHLMIGSEEDGRDGWKVIVRGLANIDGGWSKFLEVGAGDDGSSNLFTDPEKSARFREALEVGAYALAEWDPSQEVDFIEVGNAKDHYFAEMARQAERAPEEGS